jgi:hypothetical protein
MLPNTINIKRKKSRIFINVLMLTGMPVRLIPALGIQPAMFKIICNIKRIINKAR